jgi:dolichyl-phosphate-mannose-protein mannosyltransferase
VTKTSTFPRETVITILLLLLLGVAMMATNRWISFMDDEIAILQDATAPIHQTVMAFVDGNGLHRHPPLYDLILAAWMRLTEGRVALLRLPATVFYLFGLWFVILSAGLAGGPSARPIALAIGMVFPYGFHFGRIAGWYSLSFFTLALLTYAYLRISEKPGWGRWALLVFAAVLAIYANYFLFAMLGLLAIHYLWEHRHEPRKALVAASGTMVAVFLFVSPLFRALFVRVAVDAGILRPVFSAKATAFFGLYNLYTLFVSESVAPWFWFLSLPAAAAIAFCSWLLLRYGPSRARLLFVGFMACMLVMTLLNLINTKRLLFLSPWLLIPLAAMLANLPRTNLRNCAAGALLLTGAIAWFGIFCRQFYAAPRLIEPWPSVAGEVAGEVGKGAVVIGNNPSFFFYLTEAIRSAAGHPGFGGVYPVCLRHPQLFEPNQWLEAGKTLSRSTLLVKGAADETLWASTAEAQRFLDRTCHLDSVKREMPDTGYAWKQRLYPSLRQPEWRIEVRTYACGEGNATSAQLHAGSGE